MPRNLIIEEDLKSILSDDNIDWKAFEGTTVLISGANGFLPTYMVETLLYANETLLKEKVKVIGLVRNLERARDKFAHYANRDDFKILQQDVSSPMQIAGEVDYIIHAASQASPRYFFSDPVGTINANAVGTNNLLQVAKEKNVKAFLYFSSGEVYGNIFAEEAVKENQYGIVDPLYVRNCYAIGKKAGETLCTAYFHQYNVPTRIIRPAHTYGPGFSFDDGRAFTSFVASVTHGKDIVLTSDGQACRSFIYLSDATRGYFTVLLKGQNAQAYNVSNAYEISMLRLAQIVIDLSGNDNLKVQFDINSSLKVSGASMHGLLSIDKLKALGWQPHIREEQGFKRTLDYYKIS